MALLEWEGSPERLGFMVWYGEFDHILMEEGYRSGSVWTMRYASPVGPESIVQLS